MQFSLIHLENERESFFPKFHFDIFVALCWRGIRSILLWPKGMQSKYRNSGDGYRLVSPFGRNQRRGGFNRSYSKPYTAPATKLEILMEAGRLASEYLLSKGLIPSNALPREHSARSTIQEFRGHWRESPAASSFNEARVPAMARLGYPASGSGYPRKRSNDDYERFGSRKNASVRRTGAYTRGFGGLEWDRERGRNVPWMERSRNRSDIMGEEDDDFAPGHSRDRRSGHEEVGSSRVAGDEQHSKSEVVGESGSELDDAGSKASSNSTRKDAPSAGSADVSKGADDAMVSNTEAGEGKSSESEELEKKSSVEDDLRMKPVEVDEGGSACDHGNGLLKLGGFPKVPKRPRSSLAHKNPIDLGLKIEDGNRVEFASGGDAGIAVDKLFSTDGSLEQSPTSLAHKSLVDCEHGNEFEVSGGVTDTTASKLPIDGSLKDSHIGSTDNPDPQVPDSADVNIHSSKQSPKSQCDLQQNLHCSEMSIIKVDEDEDVKVTEHIGNRELEKQVCSPPPSASKKSKSSQLASGTQTHAKVIEMPLQDDKMTGPGDQLKPIIAPLVPKVLVESFLQLEGLKHNQPVFFKICDLNLMDAPEVTDTTERHILDDSHTSAPPLESGKRLSVDFGLSINNRAKSSDDFNQLSGEKSFQ